MNKNIGLILLMIALIGCSRNTNVPDNVDLKTWQDSVSYSLGSDVGATLKARKYVISNTDELAKGFIQTYKQDSSYILGASIGISYKSQMIDVDPKIFLSSLNKTYRGDSTILDIDNMKSIVRKYDQELKDTQLAEANKKMELQRINNERFIEEYKENGINVVALESGLVYRVLTEGFGDIPKETDRVIVHYAGKLIDGTVFDSSIERGEPSEFVVGNVIKGWQEALQLMKVGSKWEIVVPSDLAYGDRATGNIPAGSALIFEVELLGIE